MLDSLIHIAKFTNYRTIAVITQVSRELRDARLWRLAMREQYPLSLMNDNCEYLSDHLRYLIARVGDYLLYDGSFTLYENTNQIQKITEEIGNFVQLFPKHLGQYFVKNKCIIEISGDSQTIFNHLMKLGDSIDLDAYCVYNIKYFDYSFKCVNIDIDEPDSEYEFACYSNEDFIKNFKKNKRLLELSAENNKLSKCISWDNTRLFTLNDCHLTSI